MERKGKENSTLKSNRLRQAQNLALLDNFFWHGVFYRRGEAQLSKKQFPSKGVLHFNER